MSNFYCGKFLPKYCMETNHKELYEAPSMTVIEVMQEGVICASGDTEQFINGNSYDDSNFD